MIQTAISKVITGNPSNGLEISRLLEGRDIDHHAVVIATDDPTKPSLTRYSGTSSTEISTTLTYSITPLSVRPRGLRVI